jgi:hypothetical protein
VLISKSPIVTLAATVMLDSLVTLTVDEVPSFFVTDTVYDWSSSESFTYVYFEMSSGSLLLVRFKRVGPDSTTVLVGLALRVTFGVSCGDLIALMFSVRISNGVDPKHEK